MKRLISIVASILVVGGLFMFFSLNKQQTEQEQQYQLEIQIAKMLVSDYEGIETIEFQGWGHSLETGTWGTTVIVNNSNELGFSFSRLSGLEEISTIVTDDAIEKLEKTETLSKPRIMDRVNEINATSLDNVVVIYSRDVKGRK